MPAANQCRSCGARFEFTWKYYLLIFACAALGSQGGNIVGTVFGEQSLVLSLLLILVVAWGLVTAAWHLVPGLVSAKRSDEVGEP